MTLKPGNPLALKVLWLALTCFSSSANHHSECDSSLQECIDFSTFDDEVQEHDVQLLQVDLQLQSSRTGAKELAVKSRSESASARSGEFAEEVKVSPWAMHSHQVVALKMSLAMRSISHLGLSSTGWLALGLTAAILAVVLVWRQFSTSPAAPDAKDATPKRASGTDAAEAAAQLRAEELADAKSGALKACYFVVFVDVFGYGIFAPFVPVLKERFNLTATSIGGLLMAYSLAQAMATPVLGYISDVHGRRKVILSSLFGECCIYMILSFAQNYGTLMTCYVMSGAFAATIGVANAFVADVTTEQERPLCLNYLSGSMGLGIVLGPAAGGILVSFGFATCVRVCALISFCNLAYAWYRLPDSWQLRNLVSAEQRPEGDTSSDSKPAEEASGQPKLPRLVWFLFLCSFLAELSTANWESCGALYINETYFPGDAPASTRFFGLMMMSNGCVVLFVTIFLYPALSPYTGQLGSFVIGAIISFSTRFIALFVPSRGVFALLVGTGILGDNLSGPSVGALLAQIVDRNSIGTCSGIAVTFGALARIVAPVGFAHLYDHVAHRFPFLLVAFFGGSASLLWVWVYFQKHGTPPLEPKEVEANAEFLRRTSSGHSARLHPSLPASDLHNTSFINYSKAELNKFRRSRTGSLIEEIQRRFSFEEGSPLPPQSSSERSFRSGRAQSM